MKKAAELMLDRATATPIPIAFQPPPSRYEAGTNTAKATALGMQ